MSQNSNSVNPEIEEQKRIFKEKVRDANPIVDVFKELYPGKFKHENTNAICPFHPDKKASLGFFPKGQNPLGFKCFACHASGDVFQLVRMALNKEFKDALDYLANRAGIEDDSQKRRSRVLEKSYIYYDEQGQYLYEKRRYSGKRFFIYTKDSDGAEAIGQGNKTSHLYNLPQIASTEANTPIIYTEGEKDADNLKAVGFCSTTCGGVGVWRKVVSSDNHNVLKNRVVWIIGDNDVPGKKHELEVANDLYGLAKEIKIISLPMENSPQTKDFSDFYGIMVKTGKNHQEIKSEIESIASKTPAFSPEPTNVPVIFNLKAKREFESSEWINALIHRHHIMFHEDRFHLYSDGVYHPIRDADTEIGGLLEDLGGPDLTKKNIQEIIFKLKIRLHNSQKQKNLVVNDPWILNLKNGWIDLRDEKYTLRDHTPELLTTFKTNIDLDTEAKCHEFDAFLAKHYPNMAALIWEMMGYLLIPSTMFQKAFFIQGPPQTGKSTLIEVIELLLGKDRYSSVNVDKFTDRFSLSLLEGKLANITIETGVKGENTDKIIKALISGDSISIEEKHKQGRSIKPTARLVVASNFFLKTQDTTRAFFRRWIAIPAVVEVQKSDIIRDYSQMIFKKEKQGILLKALRGLIKLRKNGDFSEVESSEQLKHEWQLRSDHVRFWAESCLIKESDSMTKWSDLRENCNSFLNSEGFKSEFGKHEFTDRMTNLGYKPTRRSDTTYLVGYVSNMITQTERHLKFARG